MAETQLETTQIPGNPATTDKDLRLEIKQVLIESLALEGTTPEMIDDDAPLFGDEGLGLDSVDALELMVVFEKDFGIEVDIDQVGPEAFATVANMEKLIRDLGDHGQKPEGAGAA